MRFTFKGKEYRIGFKHDPSRRWEDHTGHNVGLHASNGKGPAVLHCFDCQVRLSHVPKEDRQRKTTCTIYEMVPETGAAAVMTAVARPNERVLVEITKPFKLLRDSGERIIPVGALMYMNYVDAARLQRTGGCEIDTSGDRYDREKGRHQALVNALGLTHPGLIIGCREFRAAAWAAYNGRKKVAAGADAVVAAIPRKHRAMNIRSLPGTVVWFLGCNGMPGEAARASQFLNTELAYTVRHIEIGREQTMVTLEEAPQERFNSVMLTELPPEVLF